MIKENTEIRWQQRFSNLKKAFHQLEMAVNRSKELDDLAKEGLIKRFEYTFELAWKTLKDYLEALGEQEKSPRGVIKCAFSYEIIEEGDLWMEMLANRNLMAHTYNEEYFIEIYNAIVEEYFCEVKKLYHFFEQCRINLA